MALGLMSAGRVFFDNFTDVRFFAASLIFPMVSLEIHSKLVRVLLVMLSQIFINKLVYPGYSIPYKDTNFKNVDVQATVVLCLILFILNDLIIPNCGLGKKKKQGVKLPDGKTDSEPEVHILYNITFSLLTYMAYLFLLIDIFGCMFSPYHCRMSESEAVL